MNKRKTLRMTSILLALMMFFGMVSVLLVPAGTAAAADENVIVDFEVSQDEDTLASDNYLYRPEAGTANAYNVNITVTEDIWKDDRDFSEVLLTFENPNGSSPTALSNLSMTNIGSGKWRYSFTINNSRMTGLWAIKVFRKDGTWVDGVPFYTGIFWIYDEVAKNGTLVADSTAASKIFSVTRWAKISSTDYNHNIVHQAPNTTYLAATTARKYAYAAPGAELDVYVNLRAKSDSGVGADYLKMMGYNDEIFAEYEDIAAPATMTSQTFIENYTVPSSATHKDNFEIKAFAYNGVRGAGATELKRMAVNEYSHTGTDSKPLYYKIVIDAQGPVIDDVVITNAGLVGDIVTDNMLFQHYEDKDYTGITRAVVDSKYGMYKIEMKSVTDADSGFKVLTTGYYPVYARFTNVFNPSIVYGMDWPTDGTAGIYYTGTNSYARFINLISAHTVLLNQSWKLDIVAYDALGNESVYNYGTVRVFNDYVSIKSVRVEADNVLKMYKGQVLSKEEILDQNIDVLTNVLGETAAVYPDKWYWSVDAGDSSYIDYDPETGTITALKAGEARIKAVPFDIWDGEGIAARINSSSTGHYLRVVITEAPEVTSLTLNNSTMTIDEGKTQKLTATVVPSAVAVTWETSDSSIATVASDGTVTGVKAGTAVIFAKAGHLTKSCVVTVKSTKIVDPDPPAEDLKGWVDENNNRYYYVDNQKVVGWRKIDGSWYFFDYSTAAMRANGWLKEGGKWYYLNSNGTMKSAEWFKDNNGKWYWLKANGAMAAGWEKINGTWYYFNASGAMQTGWVNVRGIWYYMKSSGAMAEGWLQDGGSWYYLTPGGGAMVTGRVTINGRASNFATSGRWLGYV